MTDDFNVSAGMILYHTTYVKYTSFLDRPTWFTPSMQQVGGYRAQIAESAITLECEFIGGKIANTADIVPFIHAVWGNDEDVDPLYSKFDAAVGEYEKEDIEKFICLCKDAGFVGCVHLDYDSTNSDKDSYTLVVFNPTVSVRIVSTF